MGNFDIINLFMAFGSLLKMLVRIAFKNMMQLFLNFQFLSSSIANYAEKRRKLLNFSGEIASKSQNWNSSNFRAGLGLFGGPVYSKRASKPQSVGAF